MYNTLGSHDTVRIKTELGGDQKKLEMAYTFLMAYPGAPAIYYGDEVGLDGGKDPDCRKAFPWNENDWDRDLHKYLQQLINIRKKRSVLRRGSYHEVLVDGNKGIYAFARMISEESLLTIMNASGTRRNFKITVSDMHWGDGRIISDLLSNQEFIVSLGVFCGSPESKIFRSKYGANRKINGKIQRLEAPPPSVLFCNLAGGILWQIRNGFIHFKM